MRIYAGTRADSLTITLSVFTHIRVHAYVAIIFPVLLLHFLPFFLVLYFPFIFHHVRNSNDASDTPAVPSSRAGQSSLVADANAASDTRMTYIAIDHIVLSWSVIEYKTRCVDTLGA